MATLSSSPIFDVDKLTNEIFSILENKFLFGYDEPTKLSDVPLKAIKSGSKGKVRILSIDGGDGILSGMSLAHLEACLCRKSGNPNSRIADYFDVVAGSGAGGVLAALLFTPGKDGRPLFTAKDALEFLLESSRRQKTITSRSSPARILNRMFRQGEKSDIVVLGNMFGECTLKDTLKSVLIPCFDLSTQAPFLFSRADALEMDGYDFKIRDVCVATSAAPTVAGGAVEIMSVDKSTRILAVDGAVAAMNNPTAAAITHVLNNKHEFPFCNGVDDLLVVSLGNGESCFGDGNLTSSSSPDFIRIAGEGSSDMVDQSVSMAFGECRATNYVRIQANNSTIKSAPRKIPSKIEMKKSKETVIKEKAKTAEEMLEQKNVEAVLFRGKKLAEQTNSEKLESFAGEVIKEHERRKSSILPTVMLKQTMPSPRTSSATTLSTLSS